MARGMKNIIVIWLPVVVLDIVDENSRMVKKITGLLVHVPWTDFNLKKVYVMVISCFIVSVGSVEILAVSDDAQKSNFLTRLYIDM